MWNAEIARKFWRAEQERREERRRATEEERGNAMRYYVMSKSESRFFEKADGSRVWEIPESAEHLSRRLGEVAIVIALDERNFNESLNSYVNGKLYAQLAYDERNGWIS